MPAFAFIIRELEGSQRTIELRNRALPYQEIEWPGEQLTVKRWYPGNRVATIQVLGPRESDLEVRGFWKSRYISSDVRLIGFDDIEATALARGDEFPGFIPPIYFAEDLREAFSRIRISGNTVQVNWGPEVRRGILTNFAPKYDRIEDIAWTATFTWSQRGERPALRASDVEDEQVEILEAMNAIDDTLAQQPPDISPDAAETIRSNATVLRESVLAFTQTLSDIQTTATTTTQDFQALQALSSRVVQAGQALRGSTTNAPYVDLLPIDTVSLVTETEVWRRTIGRDSTRVQSSAVQATNRVRQRAVPDIQQTVVVRQNETLRTLAQRFYANADSWTVIADANGLTTSLVDPGTVIDIPQSPEAGSGVAIGQ